MRTVLICILFSFRAFAQESTEVNIVLAINDELPYTLATSLEDMKGNSVEAQYYAGELTFDSNQFQYLDDEMLLTFSRS